MTQMTPQEFMRKLDADCKESNRRFYESLMMPLSEQIKREIERINERNKEMETKKIEFTINCIPPKHTAQGSSTILKNFKTGKFFIGKKSNSKAIQAKTDLMAMLLPHQPQTPLQGALKCEIEYVYPWRNSEPKKNRTTGYRWCDTRPDADNILKQFFDCLTLLRFWEDDSQVSDLNFTKRWGNEPRISVIISEINQ